MGDAPKRRLRRVLGEEFREAWNDDEALEEAIREHMTPAMTQDEKTERLRKQLKALQMKEAGSLDSYESNVDEFSYTLTQLRKNAGDGVNLSDRQRVLPAQQGQNGRHPSGSHGFSASRRTK